MTVMASKDANAIQQQASISCVAQVNTPDGDNNAPSVGCVPQECSSGYHDGTSTTSESSWVDNKLVSSGDSSADVPDKTREVDPHRRRRSDFSPVNSFADFDLTLDLDIGCGTRKDGCSAAARHGPIETDNSSDNSKECSRESIESAEDIKAYVLKHLPAHIKDKLEDEAWSRICEEIQRSTSSIGLFPTDENGNLNEFHSEAGMMYPVPRCGFFHAEEDTATTISELSVPCMDWATKEKPRQDRTERLSCKPSKTRLQGAAISRAQGLEACRRILSSDRWQAFGYDSGERRRATIDEMPAPPIRTAMNFNSVRHPPTKPMRQVSMNCQSLDNVRFGTVQVRFYERVIEINPSVSSGPAVGIGWDFKSGNVLSIDEWESQKSGLTRSGRDLVLPRQVRELMLLDAGYTQRDIAQAIRQTLRLKNQRKTTIDNLTIDMFAEEVVESAKRRLKNIFKFGSSGIMGN